SLADVADRLADVACRDDDGVDLLLVHDQMVGVPALVAGCVPAQVSGHYHRREGPVRSGLGTRYTSSSTAGARLGQPTVGPLSGTAELTVLRFDPESRRISDYRLVLVRPDATAVVTVPLRWPHQSPRLTPDPPLQ
ncbi:MAG: metallophosphoesterase, partial [Actinomycetales bacterium]|nr:metallophosphoesterase [Actinomycetales bacterium]